MKSILQTNFSGIESLVMKEVKKPEVTPDGILIRMTTLPVVPSDWKREYNSNATAELADNLPRTIGIGGVGLVVGVGANQDHKLLNQRVLVMHPQGSYSEYILTTERQFIFPLPSSISDEQAAALTAGPGTALLLSHIINDSDADNIVVTGANSVIGLFLLQQLKHSQKRILPIVSPVSQSYFNKYQKKASYQVDNLPQLNGSSLIFDLAGSTELLLELRKQLPTSPITSIVITKNSEIMDLTFVHEEFDADNYRKFIQQVADGELIVPLDRSFTFDHVKEAQYYAKESHSRGRVLITLNKEETIYD
ncbi:MDR/zinc-dependent alcohol dehydrogenase-like family protein [Pediococcus argentinicus]|uniref:NADPH quinone reductase or related Zn-dependent oxidoreductase n=1 Tax=Pediococcus argentinicus TaxID=480391 RepID=A0A0R2NGG3_9LACO|nr:hypothetical protein [Pediococcus argentinicus]KRO24905.1 NADPH quinone reductase or related Zn-dependent oxidoreductase [Pediococcus argentinicus]NKZ22604.1 zinc-binding alcohol dehydrogenase family protein [Pediococcus argentinicus]GEP19737.1 hypothetical protein LSA03_11210 [Pediococcus argentinicus]